MHDCPQLILNRRNVPSNAPDAEAEISNMITSIPKLLLLGLTLIGGTFGQYDQALVGTWSTKSRKVITGPVSAPFHLAITQRTFPFQLF
jgi:hypothetical protein